MVRMTNPQTPDEFHDPQTPDEWREAVAGADFLLRFDAARMYGLIKGGPAINEERCIEILEKGKALGHEPKADD